MSTGMYLMSSAYPQICPLHPENPHQVPTSWTPPGCGQTGSTSPVGTGCTLVAKWFPTVGETDSFGGSPFGAFPVSPATCSGPGGSLQNEFAFTWRPSRYHGGRKRKMFAVARAGV